MSVEEKGNITRRDCLVQKESFFSRIESSMAGRTPKKVRHQQEFKYDVEKGGERKKGPEKTGGTIRQSFDKRRDGNHERTTRMSKRIAKAEI